MTSKRDSWCFVLALVSDAFDKVAVFSVTYINVPLSTHCKIRYVSKYTAASRCSPCDSTTFLYYTFSVNFLYFSSAFNGMAINSLYCAEVLLRNSSLTIFDWLKSIGAGQLPPAHLLPGCQDVIVYNFGAGVTLTGH